MKTPDSKTGIGPFHVVAGMFIGGMGVLPRTPKIDAVLTVADQPGLVPDGIAHRHLPISYANTQMSDVTTGVEWVLQHIAKDRTVLIRSEGGKQRPGLVAGTCVLMMGGYLDDALICVRRANPIALTDFRYVNALRASDELLNRHRKRPA